MRDSYHNCSTLNRGGSYSGSDIKELASAAANAPVRDFLVAEAAGNAADSVREPICDSSFIRIFIRFFRSRRADELLLQVALRPLSHHDLLAARESVKPPVANFEQYLEMYGDDASLSSAASDERDVLKALEMACGGSSLS